MTTNDIVISARTAHVRELKAEISHLKTELAAAQAASAEWEKHFALALAAARDADLLPPSGMIIVLDGWNIVFNSRFKGEGDAHLGKQRLIDAVRTYARAHPTVFAWLVFDGDEDNAVSDGNCRVSYTGGAGEHRADRLVTDYVRLMRLTGRQADVSVVTNDKSFGKTVHALGAAVRAVKEFVDEI